MQNEIKISRAQFNLSRSLSCGQVFGWQKKAAADGIEWWHGCIANTPVRINQNAKGLLHFEGKNVSQKAIENYFSLSEDYAKIKRELSKDSTLKKAIACAQGLRLIKQAPFECGVSFVCASFANIPRIQKMLSNLRTRFGKKVAAFGEMFDLFPAPSSLARASEQELTECGLGYRTKYVKNFALHFEKNAGKLESLKKRDYESAKRELMQREGIGEKVADCILLFSLGHTEAFPVDVWIKRAMLQWYAKEIGNPKASERQIAEFARKKWGRHAGLAQEFLYCYSRECGLKDSK